MSMGRISRTCASACYCTVPMRRKKGVRTLRTRLRVSTSMPEVAAAVAAEAGAIAGDATMPELSAPPSAA